MIEKLPTSAPFGVQNDWRNKINELVDAVNELHEEAEENARIRANHENLIDTLVVENNIHERQIDELQSKVAILEEHAHPTATTESENVLTKSLRMDKEFAEEEYKRLQAELERTRKALDVAVDTLKLISLRYLCEYADKALEQITALEQKD